MIKKNIAIQKVAKKILLFNGTASVYHRRSSRAKKLEPLPGFAKKPLLIFVCAGINKNHPKNHPYFDAPITLGVITKNELYRIVENRKPFAKSSISEK